MTPLPGIHYGKQKKSGLRYFAGGQIIDFYKANIVIYKWFSNISHRRISVNKRAVDYDDLWRVS